ncbi:MAG: chemotaxis protein [Suipraeoptans sp.]
MQKNEPNPQTVATKKYQKKAGLINKSYKLKKTLTDDFRDACERAGVSQASQITKMMTEFIEKN